MNRRESIESKSRRLDEKRIIQWENIQLNRINLHLLVHTFTYHPLQKHLGINCRMIVLIFSFCFLQRNRRKAYGVFT